METELVKLGKKGQLSLSKKAMRRLGLEGGETLILDVTDDGAIELRPAGVYPLETYGDSRIKEFLGDDGLSQDERQALSRAFSDDEK